MAVGDYVDGGGGRGVKITQVVSSTVYKGIYNNSILYNSSFYKLDTYNRLRGCME